MEYAISSDPPGRGGLFAVGGGWRHSRARQYVESAMARSSAGRPHRLSLVLSNGTALGNFDANYAAVEVPDTDGRAGMAAIVLAAALPGAQVIAGDINSRALALTALNARVAQVSNLSAVTSNLLDGVDGNFDLIVANPPYMLDAEARTYRNGGGNYGEGLSVAMVRAGLDRLAPGGTLMLYTGTAVVRQCDQFWSALAPVLADIHCVWHYQEIDPDVFGEELEKPAYAKVERVAAVWLVVRMPD